MRKFILLFLSFTIPFTVFAQRCEISGSILIKGSEKPVSQAVVEIQCYGLWAVADNDGRFLIKGVPAGKAVFAISCLGYVTTLVEANVSRNSGELKFYMLEDNLKLESVVITAKEKPNAMATSREIGGAALDHLQMVNASDISALLPGGKTINPNLMNDNVFSLRDGGSAVGNSAFGTAVEVDGVRMSTNASMSGATGASTRNIASTNVESVEVITGVPSAEYGDISSGIVKISTRKGKTPYMVTLTTNPKTKQGSISKGFDLGNNRGILNTSVEYTRAIDKPTSPYTSYSRTGISLNYQNTFAKVLRFDFGVTGNIGGVNTKNDPDAFVGSYEKDRDNALRANMALKWQLNKSWITNLDFNASVNYEDNLVKIHSYNSNSTQMPAVHSMNEGYYMAVMLPATYFSTQFIDSKELDYAAGLKASWVRSWGDIHSNAKLGVSWTSNGNVGQGEYYDDVKLAPNGYRPRPYTDIPYMHNLAVYIEEALTLPLGSTSLQIMAGLRAEKTFIANSQYKKMSNLSPRFNLKYRINKNITIRGGWGITEKLPSFNILYPTPKYLDTRIFSTSFGSNNMYVYHTRPYETLYNEALKWQRNRNAEVGVELNIGGTRLSLVGYFNKTKYPYEITNSYDPFTYKMGSIPSQLPDGSDYKLPKNPMFKIDDQSGEIFVRDADNMDAGWVMLDSKTKRSFIKNTFQNNGSPVERMGLEFVAEFPQINPIRTQIRVDGAYGYTKYVNTGESYYLPTITQNGEPYPYVGVYPNNGGVNNKTYNGRKTHSLDMNITATTHIPSIRMIVSLRFEASLVKMSRNLSEYNGKAYAFNISDDGKKTPLGGDIYDGNSYTGIYPLEYIDLDGQRHPFTAEQIADPAFSDLILQSNNAYQYKQDGYDPYFAANLSVTKEIGDHVSLSFYANNFTNSRRAISAYATGVKVILTPQFYYGLTLRVKF